MPLIFFYPNNGHTPEPAAQLLKKSLSQTLSQYYPFSGRLMADTDGSYVDCNDEGVEFVEARVNAKLSEVVNPHKVGYEPLDHFFPTGTVWGRPNYGSLVKVQLSHFECGGLALAVSASHQIGDACTLCTFINHWAAITHNHYCTGDQQVEALPPHIISSPRSAGPEFLLNAGNNCVTTKFVLPNSKIEKIKAEVNAHFAEGQGEMATMNPTRVEVINSLLYGCAVRAAKANPSNFFQAFVLTQTVNLRKRMDNPLPETAVGNFSWSLIIPTMSESELALNSLTAQIKKAKLQLTGVTISQLNQWQNQVLEASKTVTSKYVGSYVCSSLCGYPVYKVDFGWGKPIRVTFPGSPKNFFILMDTPSGDGIEALVSLEQEDMARFEDDEQLLAFVL